MCYLCNENTSVTCLTSSVLTLSAISCDRFIAILYPLQARFRVTKHRTGILIVIIWITSLVFALPFLLTRKHYIFQWRDFLETNCGESWPVKVTLDPTTGSCIMSHPTKKIYYTFVTIALFFIPIVVMATAYTCVVWKLWANVLPGEHNLANITHQHQAKKKVIKMVCIMLVGFIICWVPLQIVVLYSQFWHSSQDGALPQWFNQASYLATFIAYSNSALNPIIYGGFNQSFREALCKIFQCDCKPRSAYPPSSESTIFFHFFFTLSFYHQNCVAFLCSKPFISFLQFLLFFDPDIRHFLLMYFFGISSIVFANPGMKNKPSNSQTSPTSMNFIELRYAHTAFAFL